MICSDNYIDKSLLQRLTMEKQNRERERRIAVSTCGFTVFAHAGCPMFWNNMGITAADT